MPGVDSEQGAAGTVLSAVLPVAARPGCHSHVGGGGGGRPGCCLHAQQWQQQQPGDGPGYGEGKPAGPRGS